MKDGISLKRIDPSEPPDAEWMGSGLIVRKTMTRAELEQRYGREPMLKVIEEAERMVIRGCREGIDEGQVRKLARVEINEDTLMEILSWALHYVEVVPFMRHVSPLVIKDVSYYPIHAMPFAYRVIGVGIGTNGRFGAIIVDGPAVEVEALAQPDERG